VTGSKISIALSAVDKFNKPVKEASKSVGQLKNSVADASKTLKGFEKNQAMIARFKGLSTQLDATTKKLAGARAETKRLKQSEMDAIAVVKQHSSALKAAELSVLEAAEAYGVESDQVAAANKEVTKLTKAKKKAETALKKERAALKSAETSSNRLSASYGKQSKELGGLRRDMGAAGLKVNALGAEELRLAKKTDLANKSLDRQTAKLKKIQTIEGRIADRKAKRGELLGDAVGVAAAAAPLVMAGKRSVDYESTFADVKKVVNFANPEEEAAYRSQMLKLAGKLGVKQDGIADIVTAAGQSGIEKDQLLAFAESATKMSVAWDVSAEEAGSTLATWRAAMGLTQKNALDLADATNYLSNNMNAKAKDIAAVMVRQGSTAMGAGLSYNETAALSASLIAGGATEETAATALKNMTGALTAGYAATGSQKDALSKIGFDPEELASSMQTDAKGTLLGVLRELQDVSADERGAVISQLFGTEIKGAVSKLVSTLDDDKNGLISAFGKVAKEADRAGSVNDEYVNRAKTRGHMLSQLGSKFDRMTITLGDRLLPVLDTVVPPLMSVVDGVSDFAEANPKLASGLLGVAAAIAVVKAGAIAFKLAKLTMGNGIDRFKLGKTKLSSSTDQTTLSANRASKALDRLNRKLGGLGSNSGGYGSGRRSRGRSRGRGRGVGRLVSGIGDMFGAGFIPESDGSRSRSKRRFRGGKFARLAGLVGSGAALSLFSGNSNAGDMAMAGADIAGAAGDLTSIMPAGKTLLKGAGKVFKPLGIALSGAALTSAITDGDSKKIGGATGDIVGGMGGALAGGAAGAAIGSVVPIVGTVIGGAIGAAIGGMGGSAAGEWLGTNVGALFSDDEDSKLSPALELAGSTLSTAFPIIGAASKFIGSNIGGWFSDDKTSKPAPAEIAAKSKQLMQVNKPIHFAPVIQITPSGDPAYDNDVSNQLMDRMKAELSPMMLGSSDVAARSDGSLSDRGDT